MSASAPSTTSVDNVLVLQIRAFLEASEDVDIDVETVEDLMQTIPADYEQPPGPEFSITHQDPSNSDEDVDFNEEELDISALYSITEEGNIINHPQSLRTNVFEAQQTWTGEEIKPMMHHLKERG